MSDLNTHQDRAASSHADRTEETNQSLPMTTISADVPPLSSTQTGPQEECPGCLVAPGSAHDRGCNHARCPMCGEQLYMHKCEQANRPVRPAMWHGIDQRAEVARALNWWTTVVGIDKPVEDYTRVLVAIALGQLVWNPRTQRYDVGSIDETRIDRALADGRRS